MAGTTVVTGASGFLGRTLVPALLAAGESIVAIGRSDNPFPAHPLLSWRRGDLADESFALNDATRDAQTIYHLAWSTVPAEASLWPLKDARDNIIGSLRLIEAAAAGHKPRFIFASSGGAIYGRLHKTPAPEDHPLNPISAYGVSKRTVEAYLDLYADADGLSPVSLRIGNLFGPGQNPQRLFGVVTQFAKAALADEPIVLFGDGSTVRDYVYIDDAVDALVRAARANGASRALNIGAGEGLSLNIIISIIESCLQRTVAVERRPARAFDAPVSVLDSSRARQEIGWSAQTPFKEGVLRTLKSLARQGSKEASCE